MQETKIRVLVFACVLVTLVVAGCRNGPSDMSKSTVSLLDSVSSDKWKTLAGRKIFFAHKSVGYNVVEGITEIEKSEPRIGVRLLESTNPADFDSPVLAHADNGVNGDPFGKLAAFRKSIHSGIGDKVGVAVVKLCWADFSPDTKTDELFAEYKKTMAELRTAYPHVTFVHSTVPLTVTQAGVKALVKNALGKPVFGLKENVVRNRYNELIRHEYKGNEPLFDLASWESTGPDGSEQKYRLTAPPITNSTTHTTQTAAISTVTVVDGWPLTSSCSWQISPTPAAGISFDSFFRSRSPIEWRWGIAK